MSPDIEQNSDGGISNFWFFGQSFIKENCHNSGTNDHIDMKLGPVTKHDRRNTATSKNFGDDDFSGNRDVIVIFLIDDQYGASGKPYSRRMVCKSWLCFKNNNFILQKLKAELENL